MRANLAPDLATSPSDRKRSRQLSAPIPGSVAAARGNVLEAKGCVEDRPRDPRLPLAGQPTARKTVAG